VGWSEVVNWNRPPTFRKQSQTETTDEHRCTTDAGFGSGSGVSWDAPHIEKIPPNESVSRGVLFAEEDDGRVDGFEGFHYARVFGGKVELHTDLCHWPYAEEIKEQEHECRYEPVGASVAAALRGGLRVRLLPLFPVFGVHSIGYHVCIVKEGGIEIHGRERGLS
jgi:hypothetical protein